MRFKIYYKSKGQDITKEIYDLPYLETFDAISQWASTTIRSFNAYADETKLPVRQLIGVVLLGKSREHYWDKSNLVTISKGGRMYDTYRCKQCGITAKRYGVGGPVIRDPKFQKPKYDVCKGDKQ